MPFNLDLSQFALPSSRTQTKESKLLNLLGYITYAPLPYLNESFTELRRKLIPSTVNHNRTRAKAFNLPNRSENNTVLKRNHAELGRKLSVLKRNNHRTNAKVSRTRTKFSPHLDESKMPNKLDSYLKMIHFLSLYVSKFKYFNHYNYQKNPPNLNENPFFIRTLCKKS